MVNKCIIFFSNSLENLIAKNKKNYFLVVFNSLNYCLIFLHSYFLYFNVYLFYIQAYFFQSIRIFLKTFFFKWTNFYLKKFLIYGRGFKLKKNFFCSNWKYNSSHFFKLFLKHSIILKNSKKKIILLEKNKSFFLSKFILNIFNRNVFLKKQIKLARGIFILKKKKS